jgi:cell division protein FtsB
MLDSQFGFFVFVIVLALVYIAARALSGRNQITFQDRQAVQEVQQSLERIEQRLDSLESQVRDLQQRENLR